ncbi:hypothetical protein HY407_00005 [Candidatus Gottesmanbacteria bacterium]|nr:hypothetical protein [Candidatus Gottesmanbacteria bacterium]
MSLLLVLGIVLAGMTAVGINLQNSQETRTRAAPFCHPLCATEPSCCAEILRQLKEVGEDIYDLPDSEQPYHACEWDAGNADTNYRGYCKPSTCSQLPEGLKYRGRCGWYWSFHEGYTNSPNGYGCMIGDTEATMRPICGGGGNPTNTPRPTNPIQPTNTPRPTRRPTRVPRPTKVPTATRVPPTPTPVYIPVTVTPNPSVTIAPNIPTPTAMIIYITSTPVPSIENPPDFTDNNLVNTPVPSQTSITNPIGGAWDSLVGFISDTKEEGMNIFGNIWKNLTEFTQTVAP